MKKCVKGLLVVLAVMLVASPALAATAISVNLVAGAGAGGTVGTQTAGAVSVGNWNDYVGITTPMTDLMDSLGNTTAASFALTSSGNAIPFAATSVGGTPVILSDPGSSAMLDGHYYETNVTLSAAFTGIPYATYDLYVYYNSSAVGNAQDFTIRGTSMSLKGYEVPGVDTALVESDGTINGNYVVFRGLTASDVTIDDTMDTYYVYMNGFQVVEVPEPLTMSLLALGGLALVRRRR